MGIKSYVQAKQVIIDNPEKAFFAGKRSEELIELAEKALGLCFSPMYRDFVISFGAGNYGAQEIFGVINNDFGKSSIPDAIWYTLKLRSEIKLPEELLVIHDPGSEEIFCLDFSRMNADNEPAIISFLPGVAAEQQPYEVIDNDFGDFLYRLVYREFNE